MDVSRLRYSEIVHFFTRRRLTKCSETLPNIIFYPMEQNVCFITLLSWNSAFRPETQVLHLFTHRRLAKCSETLPNIILGPMYQNGCFTSYPEIVHSGPKYKFCIFYVPKVSEMLWNTSKHHLGSNVSDWMLHNFATPKQCIETRNTSFASFYAPMVSKMHRNTLRHHFVPNRLEWTLQNFGTPK
jgi:hypothetical protein